MPRKPFKSKAKEEAEKKAEKATLAKPVDNKVRDAFIASMAKKGLRGDIKKKINMISTGSWVVNRLIGDGTHKNAPGGIPRGYITELYGDESTGKTTLALHVVKQALAAGEMVVYADFEWSLRTQFQYLENLGIDTNSPNFLHLIPSNFEEGAQAIGQALVKLRPALIVIDSVTAMVPKDTIEKEAGEGMAIGVHARLTGSFIKWISKKLQTYDCALLLINQLRANIKQSQWDVGPATVTTGGKSIPFFTTIRIRLKETGREEKVAVKSTITGLDDKKIVSKEVKVVIEKNKLDMPYKSSPIYIVFGQGIDNVMSLVALGINKGIIKGSGTYTWKDPNSDLSFSVKGKLGVKKHLEQNPIILKAIQPYLIPTTDDSEMDSIQEELEAIGIENLNEDQIEQLREIRKIKGQTTDDLDLSVDGHVLSSQELEELEELKQLTSGGNTEGGSQDD
jgi:recombination protein RecA